MFGRTKDGGRRTEDGGRRTEDGGRRTEDGGRPLGEMMPTFVGGFKFGGSGGAGRVHIRGRLGKPDRLWRGVCVPGARFRETPR